LPDSHHSPGSSRRLLVIMRHGKAEAFAAEDHRRRLTARGRLQSTAAGEWLAEQGMVPTEAFVSSATRTRQTWKALAASSGTPAEARVEDAVYAADADSALDVLREAPAAAEVVLYVGHNPTAASLAHLLDDGDPDPEAFRAMSAGFPTAAMAVLEIGVPWAQVGAATGHLVAFHVGKG
jgi:phosphohistidine phosphatase